jgi:hypothetical protein
MECSVWQLRRSGAIAATPEGNLDETTAGGERSVA